MREKKLMIAAITFVLLLVFAGIAVFAAPTGPSNYDVVGSERRNVSSDALEIEAQAGNVTALNINHTRVTEAWQGYYGNVSGQIVLDSAGNNSMYDWEIAGASGEVYATRNSGSVTWDSINCSNQTHVEAEEANLNISANDVDGVNETFNDVSHPEFSVGSVNFPVDQCDFTTNTYTSDAPGTDFDEILLYGDGYVVYTSLIEDGVISFDGSDADFQIIVGEDGHEGTSGSTTYYFYVELS